MKERLADALFGEGGLLRVRALITYSLIAMLFYLTLDGQLDPREILGIAGTAIGFYFGTRAAS